MTWESGLDARQREAARHTGSHARLLAGPGTGKTVTITRRLEKLILEDGVLPERILAVAFTRINAFDLRRTLETELQESGVSVPRVNTLHSYALRQLLRNAPLVTTLPQPLRIADDFEEKVIIRQDLRSQLGLTDRQIREKFADLSSDWESLAVESENYRPADPQFMGAWQGHRNLYGYTLRSELIWQLKHVIEENPDNFQLEGVIEHLVVDEYQDLNRCDLAIIRRLADLGAEVYASGDDDQSIYGFRRAHPAGIRRFLEDYHPCSALELETCWRSDTRIIDVGQHVANQDPARLPKPMRPREGAGEGTVRLLRFDDQLQEAAGVALLCEDLIEREDYRPDEIIVLLRSDHQGRYSEVLGEALNSRKLPYNVRAEAGTLLDERHGRLVLSLIRLAVNPGDDLAWRTILQFCRPGNQVGAVTVSSIEEYARTNGMRFGPACLRVRDDASVIARGSYVQHEVEALLPMAEEFAALPVLGQEILESEEMLPGARLDLLAGVTRICEAVIQDHATRESVRSYIGTVADRFGAVGPSSLLAALTSPEDTLDQELEDGKINILTMHRAKGLSARAVFIVAAEEQLIPGDAVGDEFDDARRLLYVSLTRAKEFLCISYCNKRTGRQRHSGSEPGIARRTLTPFLRGALPVTDGNGYLADLGDGL
jgi:DNA helicase-2/ATP-dependent DNA helicase PcrA